MNKEKLKEILKVLELQDERSFAEYYLIQVIVAILQDQS